MFRRLTWRRLPRVMVNCLALDPRDHEVLYTELVAAAERHSTAWACTVLDHRATESDDPVRLAGVFAAILELSRPDREEFAEAFDRLLDAQGDLFGTEGQCDPRGDRRG